MFTDFMSKFWQSSHPTEVKFSALTKFHSECLSNAIFCTLLPTVSKADEWPL